MNQLCARWLDSDVCECEEWPRCCRGLDDFDADELGLDPEEEYDA